MYDLSIRNGSVWNGASLVQIDVHVRDGKIAALGGLAAARETFDASGLLVLPGFIDPHVHFDLDLGRLRSGDDFRSGSVCAAFGGVTTFVDFLAPTDNPDDLEKAYCGRLKEAEKSVVDYRFHATIKNPQGDPEAYVLKMLALGMTTLKLFTTYSDSGRRTFDAQIERLLDLSERYGFTILAHIEDDARIVMKDSFTHRDLPESRPAAGETAEALKLAGFVERHGGILYMVHLSSGTTLDALRAQYPRLLNKRFFIESCPQYFAFTSADLSRPDGYLYTMAPVLRTAAERDRLAAGFSDVHAIGTDHCPFAADLKRRERLSEIPMGIGGVEHGFETLYPRFGLAVVPKMTEHPAAINGLAGRKGVIAVGADADFAIVREGAGTIGAGHSQTGPSLYAGMTTNARIEATILRGNFAVKDGKFLNTSGTHVGRRPSR